MLSVAVLSKRIYPMSHASQDKCFGWLRLSSKNRYSTIFDEMKGIQEQFLTNQRVVLELSFARTSRLRVGTTSFLVIF